MRQPKGFTLLEFLLYFALLGTVITSVTIFALDITRSSAKVVIIAEVEQNMRFGLQRILRTVRQAAKVNSGASTFDSDDGVLSVNVSAASNSPTIFNLSGGILMIKEGAAAAVPLTGPNIIITKLRFSKDNLTGNNVAVTTEMSMTHGTSNTDQVFRYSTSASGTAVIRKD